MTVRYVRMGLDNNDGPNEYAIYDLPDELDGLELLELTEETLDQSYLDELDDDGRDSAGRRLIWHYRDDFSGKWRRLLEVAA